MLKVNELFLSFQGEGPKTGVKSTFLRLQGCNAKCKWCDTPGAIKINAGHDLSVDALDVLLSYSNNLVITGGEPLLQQNDPEFLALVYRVAVGLDKTVEIETNGTIEPILFKRPYAADLYPEFFSENLSYNVSPKLTHSGMAHKINEKALKLFSVDDANFKFVIDMDDHYPLAEVEAYQERYKIKDQNIWLMPEGTDKETILHKTTLLMNLQHNYNVSTRLHILTGEK